MKGSGNYGWPFRTHDFLTLQVTKLNCQHADFNRMKQDGELSHTADWVEGSWVILRFRFCFFFLRSCQSTKKYTYHKDTVLHLYTAQWATVRLQLMDHRNWLTDELLGLYIHICQEMEQVNWHFNCIQLLIFLNCFQCLYIYRQIHCFQFRTICWTEN